MDGTERRLVAILSADVAGYSRLLADDELATIRTLREQRESIELLVRQHGGRVVDSPGDNLLAEFPVAFEAVRCALEIQALLDARNATVATERRMDLRIGIHLGDIVVEGERIYGDGVNIAARLEGLADAGGICVSGAVQEQVRNKLDLALVDLGNQALKNITDPLRVYRVRPRSQQAETRRSEARHVRRPMWLALAPMGTLLLLIAAGLWATWPRPLGLVLDLAGVTQLPAEPSLPDKPSIVILPFSNLSGDPAQEYFSDGVTEEVTADLAGSPELFVIARNTAFSYKGKAVPIEAIGRELGVRYVVEGSVRRADDRVRITAQLIDAGSEHHLWSEQYDRTLQDVFAVQSEISEAILVAVGVEVRQAELSRIRRRPTADLTAYESYARGFSHYMRFTRSDLAEARRLLQRAIELDPEYTDALTLLGGTYVAEYALGWSSDPTLLARGRELAERTRQLDPDHPGISIVLAAVALNSDRPDEAVRHADRGIELAPSAAAPRVFRAIGFAQQGEALEALGSLRLAMRLDLRLDDNPATGAVLAGLYFQTGHTDKALELWERERRANPDLILPRLGLVHEYLAAGRSHPAAALVAEIRLAAPELTAGQAARISRRFLGNEPGEEEEFAEGLRRVGLPGIAEAREPDSLAVRGFSSRPAVAVLPFENLGGDSDQEYLADGIVEDLTTRLSGLALFPVIARTSTFTYKGQVPDVKQLGQELGARYIVEGSVRRAENRIRVTAQLVDAASGHHLWAEQYDRELSDVFAVQDEITEQIAGSIFPELRRSETGRAARSNPANLDAWESYHRGWVYFYEVTKEGNARARDLFERAAELDPRFAEPWGAVARTHQWDLMAGWSDDPGRSAAEAMRTAQRCVTLDDLSPWCQISLGWSQAVRGDADQAIRSFEAAVRLNPSSAGARLNLGLQLAVNGRPDQGIAQIERAMRLSPRDPERWLQLSAMAMAHYAAERYEQAVDWGRRSLQLKPDWLFAHIILAASYGQLGRHREARAALAESRRLRPDWSPHDLPWAMDPAFAERFRRGLDRAG